MRRPYGGVVLSLSKGRGGSPRHGPAAQPARSLVDERIDALVLFKTMEVGEKRMWQERIAPRSEGEKMHTLLKTKIGPFLVISSVLALWTLLAAQHVQAHESTERLPTPSCSTIPGDAFFGTSETHGITSAATALADTDLMTRRGGGTSGRGDIKYHYAKITIPALAAGELRVFDTTTRTDDVLSDAVLCRGSSSIASSTTSYTVHDTADAAADAADDMNATTTSDDHTKATNAAAAAGAAITAADDATATPALTTRLSNARRALSTARSALSTARGDLATAAKALNSFAANASDPAAATTAVNAVDEQDGVADDEQAALDAFNNSNTALPPSNTADTQELTAVQAALGNVQTALTAAAAALTAAATALTEAANSEHTGFNIRAEVSPGDQEYIVVVAPRNTGDPARANEGARTLNLAFHGAIVTGTSENTNLDGSLRTGDRPSYTIKTTASGLLTLETTGSTDTAGTLDRVVSGDGDIEITMAESGGIGGNFKIVAPVTVADHALYIVGQNPRPTGDYTLDMDFKVAMTHVPDVDVTGAVDVADGPDWGAVNIRDDGGTVRPELDSRSDEDYFLFTIADDEQGFLTVEATDDSMTTAASDAATTGTLYGPMGEIDTDSDSGAGSHFRINTPVEMGDYLVKVTGSSAGGYILKFVFTTATDLAARGTAGSLTTPINCQDTNNDPYEICAATGAAQEVDQYIIPIAESGALYVNTVGDLDTVGVLYGPDGSRIVENDDSSAENNNFRIAANVRPGLHLLQVRAKTRTMSGVYQLVTSFVTGEEVTTPTRPPGTGGDLQDRVDELEALLDECRMPVETDTRGSTLENPPDGGYRSGIGVISGWVCAAEEVEIVITSNDRQGSAPVTLNAAYGTSRPDVPENSRCNNENAGFGMTYNFNHLREGEYTITAYADSSDDEENMIGTPRTFEVVHLTPFDINDDDRFLRDEDLQGTECRVNDFPALGEDTILEWEESTQNFTIIDAG